MYSRSKFCPQKTPIDQTGVFSSVVNFEFAHTCIYAQVKIMFNTHLEVVAW